MERPSFSLSTEDTAQIWKWAQCIDYIHFFAHLTFRFWCANSHSTMKEVGNDFRFGIKSYLTECFSTMDRDDMFTFSKQLTEHSDATTLWTPGATCSTDKSNDKQTNSELFPGLLVSLCLRSTRKHSTTSCDVYYNMKVALGNISYSFSCFKSFHNVFS